MDGYHFQTHSVYRDRESGGLLLLVHHNPMALCSLMLNGKEGSFDPADPQVVGVDTIIAMRRSGRFQELPPLPENEITALLTALLPHAAPADQPLVQTLIDQLAESSFRGRARFSR